LVVEIKSIFCAARRVGRLKKYMDIRLRQKPKHSDDWPSQNPRLFSWQSRHQLTPLLAPEVQGPFACRNSKRPVANALAPRSLLTASRNAIFSMKTADQYVTQSEQRLLQCYRAIYSSTENRNGRGVAILSTVRVLSICKLVPMPGKSRPESLEERSEGTSGGISQLPGKQLRKSTLLLYESSALSRSTNERAQL
jgi:hypothetical protein